MSKTIAVFFGGNSNEHEISIITGMLCVNLLRGAEQDVLPVYLTRENELYVGEMRAVTDFKAPSKKWKKVRFYSGGVETERGKKFPVDVALNCCHGGEGEDGTLSALFRWYGLKSASPDAALSAVFMDKTLTKSMARGLGLPVLDGATVKEGEGVRNLPFSYPVIVKPARLGSSIGIKVAENEEELDAALSLAFTLDRSALIEPYVREKRDLNCAACRMDGKIVLSQVEEVFSRDDILSFREKYESGDEKRSQIPADIPENIAHIVQNCTKTLYESFHAKGVVRADFLLVGDEVYFNELNTVPGSLACYLFGNSLTDAKQFLLSLIEEGKKQEPPKRVLTTGILESSVFTGKGGKRRI